MLRSLYTGISGLRSHQTMMDVTGNNIANVNTTGYKSANTVFEDTLSQTLANAGAPQGQQGGTNPAQVGLGVRVAGVTTNFSQGATQVTGRNTDMLVSGDGFFVVKENGINRYTRSGAFSLDAGGQLVSMNGSQVQGWMADARGAVNTQGITESLRIPTGLLTNPRATENLVYNGNLNSNAQVATATDPGGTVSSPWPVYDRSGVSNDATVEYKPVAPAPPATGVVTAWDIKVSHPGLATPVTGRLSVDYATTPPTKTLTATSGGTATGMKLNVAGVQGTDGQPFAFDLDLSRVTTTASASGTSTIKVQSQDGAAAASLTSWKIGPDGTISGQFSDGNLQTIGRVALANFDNAAGLSKEGGSVYSQTVNSGNPAIGSPGDAGRGSIVSGALEMSNVDLAQEFTNLIISQRGFQANSRVITSADEMLQELVNLKR